MAKKRKRAKRRCTGVIVKCSCGKGGRGKVTTYRSKCGGRRRRSR